MQTINGYKVGAGDLYAMCTPHRDTANRVWPAGTEYKPYSCGLDSATDKMVQYVTIGGKIQIFPSID